MNGPKRILLVRHGAFGDCLLITPFIRQLRASHRDAEIHVLSFFDFFQHYPEVNQWIDARKVSFEKIATEYDEIRFFSYEQAPASHILDGFEFSSELKLKIDAPFVPEVSPEVQNRFLKAHGLQTKKYIVFTPFAGPHARDLVESRAAEIVERMQSAFPEYRIVLFHNKKKFFSGAINVLGKRTFLEMVTLMRNSSACLTVDTGFLHLAQACGTPTVVIAGPTDPALRITRPELAQTVQAPVECLGCYHRHIGTFGTAFTTCFRQDWACKFSFSTQECVQKLKLAIDGARVKPARTLRRNPQRAAIFRKMASFGDLKLHNVQAHYCEMIERERVVSNSLKGRVRTQARLALDLARSVRDSLVTAKALFSRK